MTVGTKSSPVGVPKLDRFLRELFVRALQGDDVEAIKELQFLEGSVTWRYLVRRFRGYKGAGTQTSMDALQAALWSLIDDAVSSEEERIPDDFIERLIRLTKDTIRAQKRKLARRRMRYAQPIDKKVSETLADRRSPGPETSVQRMELRNKIEQLIDDLPEKLAAVARLAAKGLKQDLIAEMLEIGEDAVRKRLDRAFDHLRGPLSSEAHTQLAPMKGKTHLAKKSTHPLPTLLELKTYVYTELTNQASFVISLHHFSGKSIQELSEKFGTQETQRLLRQGYLELQSHFRHKFPEAFEQIK